MVEFARQPAPEQVEEIGVDRSWHPETWPLLLDDLDDATGNGIIPNFSSARVIFNP